MRIPKIIHQIYEDPAGPSDLLLSIAETWKEKHPDWEYQFWNRQKIWDFLETRYPEFIPKYKSFKYDVQRWDAIRYLILYYFGGLYVDMDYECIENMEPLLVDSDCCMGMEPYLNARQNGKSYIVGNALMASVPGHEYMKCIINSVFSGNELSIRSGLLVMESTGPFMITRLYDNYTQKQDITLLPNELVAPLSSREVRAMVRGDLSLKMEDKVEHAFAIHYFLGTWYDQMVEKTNKVYER